MKRSLVKHGDTTLMVSVPAKWVKRNKLGKGDEVTLEEKDNQLTLSLEEKQRKKQTSVKITSLTETSVRTILTNLYRLGYDSIEVHFSDENVIMVIEKVIKHDLIGFEIIKKTDTNCIVENITEPSKDQFDNIFSKILLNIDSLFVIVKEALMGNKKEFSGTETQIKAFDNFCRRVISKRGNYETDQLQWVFQSELTHAQRELYLLLLYLSNCKVKADKKILDLYEKCKKMFEILKEAYKKKDTSLLEKMHALEKKIIYQEGYNILNHTKETIVIHHLLSASRGFYLASSPLFGLFIER